jgi:hypothetical protein
LFLFFIAKNGMNCNLVVVVVVEVDKQVLHSSNIRFP